ncbi:TetR/AcrR family transcriptional regulator [Paracoccaceae bacterium GXU_MW_L88]
MPGRGDGRGYHHGNLKETLVEAALKLISEKGPRGFTFAEAAREAGVTPAAPYRHFKNRDELIEEVARRGFETFLGGLEQISGPDDSPVDAFYDANSTYLAFAQSNPGYYIAMFEAGVNIDGNPGLKLAAGRALDALEAAVGRMFENMPEESRPPAAMVAHHIWALCHGIATLFTLGRPGERVAQDADKMLRNATKIYLRGLGLDVDG